MTTMVVTYAIYLVVCIGVTVWVARTLERHAPALVSSPIKERAESNDAITKLSIVGFYLVNVGAICFALKFGGVAMDTAEAIELLSSKIGIILIGLGFVHFCILAKLASLRNEPVFNEPISGFRKPEHRPYPTA